MIPLTTVPVKLFGIVYGISLNACGGAGISYGSAYQSRVNAMVALVKQLRRILIVVHFAGEIISKAVPRP
jgi:hypothetical protein